MAKATIEEYNSILDRIPLWDKIEPITRREYTNIVGDNGND